MTFLERIGVKTPELYIVEMDSYWLENVPPYLLPLYLERCKSYRRMTREEIKSSP